MRLTGLECFQKHGTLAQGARDGAELGDFPTESFTRYEHKRFWLLLSPTSTESRTIGRTVSKGDFTEVVRFSGFSLLSPRMSLLSMFRHLKLNLQK